MFHTFGDLLLIDRVVNVEIVEVRIAHVRLAILVVNVRHSRARPTVGA